MGGVRTNTLPLPYYVYELKEMGLLQVLGMVRAVGHHCGAGRAHRGEERQPDPHPVQSYYRAVPWTGEQEPLIRRKPCRAYI